MEKIRFGKLILTALVMLGLFAPTYEAVAVSYIVEEVTAEEMSDAAKKIMPTVVSIIEVKNVARTQAVLGTPQLSRSGDILHYEVPVAYREVVTPMKAGVGSGFIGTTDGKIFTAKHVVQDPDSSYVVILPNGTRKAATVVYRDPIHDIALIDIEGTYTAPAILGDSSETRKGEIVTAIGNALGKYEQSISEGSVTAFNRKIRAENNGEMEILTGLYETTAPILPGYSGGPVVDADGEVVGISVATNSLTGNGYYIPIDTVKESVPLS